MVKYSSSVIGAIVADGSRGGDDFFVLIALSGRDLLIDLISVKLAAAVQALKKQINKFER